METNKRNNFSKEEIEQGRLERKTLRVSRRYIASKKRGILTREEVQRQLQLNSVILKSIEGRVASAKALMSVYSSPVMQTQWSYENEIQDYKDFIQHSRKFIKGLSDIQKKLKQMR